MARLARSSRPVAQEIPDSYRSQQQELPLDSSDVEPEDDDDTQLLQHQLAQEAHIEDDEDDDDGAVNLFLPDIVDIVNKAATPSKSRGQGAHRLSSAPKSSPIAAARQDSSPRSQNEVIAATQNTQSSTQSEDLSHFKNYQKQQARAQAKTKTKTPPLPRPSTRPKPLSRSATPNEEPVQGKPDPYEFPASPEAEVRPAPVESPAAKKTSKPKAGQKRKRKQVEPAPRSVTPDEPVVSKRPRRGVDKPQFSPSSLRKLGRATRAQKAAQKGTEQTPAKRSQTRSKEAVDPKLQEEPESEVEEKIVPIVAIPIMRTRSREAELEAEILASSAQESKSVRGFQKKAQGAAQTGQPASEPQTGFELLKSLSPTVRKSGTEKPVTQVPATQSQPIAVPKSAYAAYKARQQQAAVEEDEPVPEIEASSPIPETPEHKKRAKSSSVAPQSASPRVLRNSRKHFKDTTSPDARTTRSRKQNETARLDAIAETAELEEEVAEFNMEDVPESLFHAEEEEEEADQGQGQPQPALDDDYPDDEYVAQEAQEDDVEEMDENSEEGQGQGGVGGISSILMDPSPKKVPSQKIAVPQRQLKAMGQQVSNGESLKAAAAKETHRKASPPPAQTYDDEESAPAGSQRDENLADDSQTTMDFSRNPFEEPTFDVQEAFDARSRAFITDVLHDPDVDEVLEFTEVLQTDIEGVERHTQKARDIQKIRRYLVSDYKSMKELHDSDEHDEGVISDLYANVYTNTRKLHKQINELIDDDLGDEEDNISTGELVTRNKARKKLLRDVYLFILPDMLQIITSMIETYCADGPPGISCFEELHGLVRLTLSLLRTAGEGTNLKLRPKQLRNRDIDYQYPKFRSLLKTLRNINKSCQTIIEVQSSYESYKEFEEQVQIEAEKEKIRQIREFEAFWQAKAEEDAAYERQKKKKLQEWAEKNKHILTNGRPIPRQITQLSCTPSMSLMAERREEANHDPFEVDIRGARPTVNGQRPSQKPRSGSRDVEARRKPIVSAAGRKVAWSQDKPKMASRPHTLPMSNDDSDDEGAFDPPQEPKRRFVHHPLTTSEEVDPFDGNDDAFMAMDLDDEEDELPVHPTARGVPRARIEEEELSLTQRRLNEEQRIKMLNAELQDLLEAERKKREALQEVERRKRELEIREREFYEGRGEDEDDDDLDLDDLHAVQDDEEGEEGFKYDEDEEEEESVEVGTSFPGNNNRVPPAKPWTREELAQLIEYLKFHLYEKKYVEAADRLERELEDVIDTAKEHKEVWAEKYRRETGSVPEWVRCIGENVACETFGEAVTRGRK